MAARKGIWQLVDDELRPSGSGNRPQAFADKQAIKSEAAISPASALRRYGHGDGKSQLLIAKSSIEQDGYEHAPDTSGAGLIRALKGTRPPQGGKKKLEKRRLVSSSYGKFFIRCLRHPLATAPAIPPS